MTDDANEVSAREVVDCITAAWRCGESDEAIIGRLGNMGLSQDHAIDAIEMVRSAYGRVVLFGAGMQPRQISSNFDDDPIFVAALEKARAETPSRPPRTPRSLCDLAADLDGPDVEARRHAAYELGQTRSPSAVPLLLSVLDDADPYVRIYAIQSLRDLRAKEAVPALCTALASEEDETVLSNVIRALEAIGSKSAVPALIEATRHPDAFARHNAAWALGELGDRRAIRVLEALLDDTAQPEGGLDEHGMPRCSSVYRVCDQARMALEKLRP